jgi:hypothetical protein
MSRRNVGHINVSDRDRSRLSLTYSKSSFPAVNESRT